MDDLIAQNMKKTAITHMFSRKTSASALRFKSLISMQRLALQVKRFSQR
jgi:hypothetical protein